MTRVVPQPTAAYSLFWFGVDTDVYDYYYDSSDPAPVPVAPGFPATGLFPADDLYPVGAAAPGTGQFPADDLFPDQ